MGLDADPSASAASNLRTDGVIVREAGNNLEDENFCWAKTRKVTDKPIKALM